MADIQDRRAGGGGGNVGQIANYKDVAGSTYRAEEVANDLYVWDATSLAWVKAPADHATGAQIVTANAGTNLNTSALALDATLTGGTQKAIARGGAKGSTTAADVTSTASGANHQPIDVALYDGSGNQLGLSGAPVRVDPTGTTAQPVSQATASSLNAQVVGSVATGGGNAGNPVKIGAAVDTTLATLSNGNITDLKTNAKGYLLVSINDGQASTAASKLGVLSDGNSNSVNGMYVNGFNSTFNGTTWDRQRGNVDTGALITGTAATSTQTGADQTNYNGKGLVVTYDCTAVTGSGSFTVSIQGKDTASGKYYTILAGTARSTTGTDILTVYPGLTAAANVTANNVLPRTWRVVATYNSGTNQTFTVAASVLL